MIFTDDQNRDLSREEFISFWVSKYEKYNPSSYSDKVYLHFIEKELSKDKLLWLGAWKWNMISKTKKNNLSIEIDGNTFWFKNGWSDNLTKKPKKEYPIYKYLLGHTNKLKFENINNLFYELLKIQNCGFVNAVFIIHILFPKRYPIYDQFVHYSYDFIVGNVAKSDLIKRGARYIHFYEYCNGYATFFRNLCGNNQSIDNQRELDKALWSFGKFIINYKATETGVDFVSV